MCHTKTTSMYKFYFEKLEVWKKSRKLVCDIYKITDKYPNSERFNFIDQMRRASCSVSNNLAEGNSKRTKKEQARYTSISHGSLMEVLNLLILSKDLGYIDELTLNEFYLKISIIARQLNALLNVQLKSISK